jgi:hypothetical protein
MAKIITSKIKRGSLIQYALDDIKRESFNIIRRELRGVLKGRAGIYALYKKGKVVKVGLGTSIYGRVDGHSKSKKMNWDTASLFIIKNIKYLRDVETAVNRIAKPKYSIQRGRVGDEHYFEKILKKSVNEKKKKLRAKSKKQQKQLNTLGKDILNIEAVMKK